MKFILEYKYTSIRCDRTVLWLFSISVSLCHKHMLTDENNPIQSFLLFCRACQLLLKTTDLECWLDMVWRKLIIYIILLLSSNFIRFFSFTYNSYIQCFFFVLLFVCYVLYSSCDVSKIGILMQFLMKEKEVSHEILAIIWSMSCVPFDCLTFDWKG